MTALPAESWSDRGQFLTTSDPGVRVRSTLAALRDATGRSHQALEATVGPVLAEGRPFDVDDYRRFLLAHERLHRAVADAAASCPGFSLLDWPDCARLSMLEQDLVDLGRARSTGVPPPEGVEPDDERVVLTRPDGEPIVAMRAAHVAGLAYVVEGSSLGSRQILSALRKHDSFQLLGVHSYLSSSVSTAGPRWKATLEVLEEHGGHDLEGVIAGALAGFGAFGRFWSEATTVSDHERVESRRSATG